MNQQLQECPVCHGKSITEQFDCTDHFLTQEKFTLAKCDDCSFLFTNPRPPANKLDKYYQSEEYISHSNKSTNLLNTFYKLARKFTLWQKVKLINSLNTHKTILDFGCGTGDFLNSCKNSNWKIDGFEPDVKARLIASTLNEIQILSNPEQVQKLEHLGLITLWHVLEHIPNLNETIATLISRLDQNGKMLIAVPNYKSYDAQLYHSFWAAYDVPRHLYHFSQSTMELLLNNHGLKINKVIPMKLDSFYVSLLSEKYKHGKINYIKSFINGYKSNIYANKNNNNFSSIIYIASK